MATRTATTPGEAWIPRLRPTDVVIAGLQFVFSGEFMVYVRKFWRDVRHFRHPLFVTALSVMSRSAFVAKMTDGEIERIDGLHQLQSIGRRHSSDSQERVFSWTCKQTGVRVEIHHIVDSGTVADVFEHEDYSWLPVTKRTVVDVGANIADSSIYFAAKGANRVLAYEPFPRSYESAVDNLRVNSLEKKVKILNAGVGVTGFVRLSADFQNQGASDVSLSATERGVVIPILSLEELVRSNLLSGASLKMDCEGCEYAAILSADTPTLRSFDSAMIEYHYGSEPLVEKFRAAGFQVQVDEPRLVVNIHAKRPITLRGIIRAKRLG